jgi:hypothetical protein
MSEPNHQNLEELAKSLTDDIESVCIFSHTDREHMTQRIFTALHSAVDAATLPLHHRISEQDKELEKLRSAVEPLTNE